MRSLSRLDLGAIIQCPEEENFERLYLFTTTVWGSRHAGHDNKFTLLSDKDGGQLKQVSVWFPDEHAKDT